MNKLIYVVQSEYNNGPLEFSLNTYVGQVFSDALKQVAIDTVNKPDEYSSLSGSQITTWRHGVKIHVYQFNYNGVFITGRHLLD